MEKAIEKFASLSFADAQIQAVHIRNGELCIQGKDWQEKDFVLVFTDFIGLEAFGIEGQDLGHGTATSTDEFISRACKLVDDESEGVICFSFYSAWADKPIMKVAARSFHFE